MRLLAILLAETDLEKPVVHDVGRLVLCDASMYDQSNALVDMKLKPHCTRSPDAQFEYEITDHKSEQMIEDFMVNIEAIATPWARAIAIILRGQVERIQKRKYCKPQATPT